eukprot:CAMPEP_0183332114 /NCGR_PEP_ID=MMETSP0164_2-20130417/1356_1 /TAXON_ID=221442 /ORGANISM="Coccolithus pelagicus ssp braarudi, Strain PLY182g" /LENGTH=79 /DNA_ID=CAMNT_0025500755 /DNA_START=118 /DNA_END=353 /DNA_ORIENTATION=-
MTHLWSIIGRVPMRNCGPQIAPPGPQIAPPGSQIAPPGLLPEDRSSLGAVAPWECTGERGHETRRSTAPSEWGLGGGLG